jgi:hypothetical protein
MYIPSKFKCQLSFNWHLNLIEVCTTQSWVSTEHELEFTIRITINAEDPSRKDKRTYHDIKTQTAMKTHPHK